MAVPTLQYGQTVVGVETTATTGIIGQVFALPPAANVLTYQTVHPDSPSAVNYGLQGSMDGINWITLSGTVVVAGVIASFQFVGYKYIRCISNARTGGSSSKMLICIAKRG